MSDENRGTYTTNRRQVLASLGAVGAAGLGVPTAAATPGRVQVRLGSFDEPVSENERRDARHRAFESFSSAGGAYEGPVGSVEQDDGRLVGTVSVVTDDGTLREFDARAETPEEARAGLDWVRRRASQFRTQVTSPDATTSSGSVSSDSVSTQASSWNGFYGHASWSQTDPYGQVENEVWLYHLQSDGRSDYEAFIAKHDFVETPGYKVYDSGYRIKDQISKFDWSTSGILYRTVDYEPSNDHTGPKTLDVSVSPDPTYDYSWSLDDGTAKKTSTQNQQSNGYGEWTVTYSGYYGTQQKEHHSKPATSAWVHDQSSGTYDLAKVTAEGVFEIHEDNYYNTQSITDTKTMQVEFGSDGPIGRTK